MKKNKNNDNHIEAGNSKREGLKMPLHAEISSQSADKSVAGSTTNKSILNTGRFFSSQIQGEIVKNSRVPAIAGI